MCVRPGRSTISEPSRFVDVSPKWYFRKNDFLAISIDEQSLNKLDGLKPVRLKRLFPDVSRFQSGEIGFDLSQYRTGACHLPSPIPKERGDPRRGGGHDKDQRQLEFRRNGV